MAPQTSTRMTYEDYLELPDDGKRYEVIEGELVVNASPYTRHQRIVGRLYAALEYFCRERRCGEAFVSPVDVVLADDSVVQPDVMVVSASRLHIVGEKNIEGAPDLVIEVLSEGTRKLDELVKRKLYERHGVNKYWVVDPVLELVKIYRRMGDAFTRVSEISVEAGGALTSTLLPEFSLDIRDVFPRV